MHNNLEQIRKQTGKLLRKLRIQAGFTCYESFAFEHKLSRIQYWRMESGNTNYTIKSLIKILNIHGICYYTEFPKYLRNVCK